MVRESKCQWWTLEDSGCASTRLCVSMVDSLKILDVLPPGYVVPIRCVSLHETTPNISGEGGYPSLEAVHFSVCVIFHSIMVVQSMLQTPKWAAPGNLIHCTK